MRGRWATVALRVREGALGRPREAGLTWGLTGAVMLLDTPLTGIILRATGDVLAWTPFLFLRGPVHFGVLALLWLRPPQKKFTSGGVPSAPLTSHIMESRSMLVSSPWASLMTAAHR